MLHITTTMLLILPGLAALVAFAIGSALSSARAISNQDTTHRGCPQDGGRRNGAGLSSLWFVLFLPDLEGKKWQK